MNLFHLELGANNISNINPLSGLVNLEHLGLSDNQISSIDAISPLTQLGHILVSNNSISNIDILADFEHLCVNGWRNGFQDTNLADGRQTKYPNMVPMLLEDNQPWEVIRSKKGELENGIYYPGDPYDEGIHECKESNAETVFAPAVFQFPGDDIAYLWITNVTDWGVGNSFNQTKYNYNYTKDRDPWYSYIATWYPGQNIRVDDMSKTVMWYGNGPLGDTSTSFVTPSVWVEGNIKTEPNGTGLGPGIWIWHTGRYRASGIYLSYAKKEDVLKPENYMHFAGFSDMTDPNPDLWIPEWTSDEEQAVSVIQEFDGEISGVFNPWTEEYNVFYQPNSAGQRGIVMRESSHPWGLYSSKYLMVDCVDLDRKVDELNGTTEDYTGIWSDQGGGCYGGYTHPDLWECDQGEHVIRVRFNASLWNPYKVLMIEAEVPFSGSCD